MKYPCSAWTLTVLLAFPRLNPCLAASSADDGAILVLGDSWASLSGSFLANVCSLGTNGDGSSLSDEPRALTNNGKSGSTAKQWASGELAKESFKKATYDYDYVWLSIGGNDFNCDESIHEEIAENILDVISDIIESSSNDEIQILFTGYGYPSGDICGSDTTTTLFDSLSLTIRKKIELSSHADKVQTMDISSLFVTEKSSPLSDKTWYADNIHINEAAYVKLFSMQTVQEFFGCIVTTGESPTPVPHTDATSTESPSIAPMEILPTADPTSCSSITAKPVLGLFTILMLTFLF